MRVSYPVLLRSFEHSNLPAAALPQGACPPLRGGMHQDSLLDFSLARDFFGDLRTLRDRVRAVSVSFMQHLEKRWDSRRSGLEPLTVTTSSVIDAPVESVWAFLTDFRSAMLTSSDLVKAFHVPGTPVGAVGEQHCIIMTTDARVSAHISEVVTLEPPYRLVTRWVTIPTEALSILTLTPEDSRTHLTYQLGTRIERGTTKRTGPTVRAAMQDHLKRVRAYVESGARFPAV